MEAIHKCSRCGSVVMKTYQQTVKYKLVNGKDKEVTYNKRPQAYCKACQSEWNRNKYKTNEEFRNTKSKKALANYYKGKQLLADLTRNELVE